MAGWQVGLVVMMAVGMAVIIFGALWDRERNRRNAERLTRAPDRPIPGYAGEDPAYVLPRSPSSKRPRERSSGLSKRPPKRDDTLTLTDLRRSTLKRELAGVPSWPAPLASGRFVTDATSGWAVLDSPVVLACAEPVGVIREILPVLGRCASEGVGLVVVAPGYAQEVLATLITNHEHQTVQVAAVLADKDDLTALATACGATLLTRTDLAAGWMPASSLGSAGTWVSSVDATWLIQAGGTSD